MDLQLFEKLRKVTEEVAVEISPQEKMRKQYKSVLNSELKPSTHYREKWYKFWLLTNGDIIPVESSHDDTSREADTRSHTLQINGAIAGSYDDQVGSLQVDGILLTSQQISKLKQLYIKYKPTSLIVDVEKLGSFYADVKSVKELDYLLTYGKDVDEAKSEEDEKEQFFVERTEKHIGLVQGAAAKILDAYPEYDTEMLRDQIEVHDASKLEEPERTPYIEITWRHKLENEKGEFDPLTGKGYQTPGKLEKEDENEACLHHVATNSHHPEYHVREEDRPDDPDSDECIDASLMPPSDIVEMVADWQAMSEELQTNTSREWFEKQKDVRWRFSEEQEEQIDKLLAVFE